MQLLLRFIIRSPVSGNFIKKEMSAPEIFKSTGNDISVHPIYSLTQGINSKYLERLVIHAFSAGISDLKDPIPKDIREKIQVINTFNISARYDDYKKSFEEKCTNGNTTKQVKNIEEVRNWLKKQ